MSLYVFHRTNMVIWVWNNKRRVNNKFLFLGYLCHIFKGFYDLCRRTTCKCTFPVHLCGNSGRKMEINPGSAHSRRGPSGFASEGRDCSEMGYSLCWALRLNGLWWTSGAERDRKPWWHDRDLLFTRDDDDDACSEKDIDDKLLHKIWYTYDNI